jgi:hypothetical protein
MAKSVSLVMALVLALCVTSRFPLFAAKMPAFVDELMFVVAGIAIGITIAMEARMERGTVGALWMRVAAPAKLGLAFGLSFITTVIAQTLQISLGPVDPSFGGDAPDATKALWFFVFTIGFAGIGMMSAPGIFLPPFHPIARVTNNAAPIVLGALFATLGAALAVALTVPAVHTIVDAGRAWCDENATLVLGVTIAVSVGPAMLPSKSDD